MPVFSSARRSSSETLLFPYLSGAEFMRAFKEKTGKSPLDVMPVSTEQVMHDDRFFLNRDDPRSSPLPAPTGRITNDLGEFETRPVVRAPRTATLLNGAAGGMATFRCSSPGACEGLAWVSVWDTSVDSAEFYDLLDTAILKRFGAVKPSQATQERRVYSARGRTIAVSAADIGGRPVVLYVDVPAGASIDVLDLRKVTLEE
jgi:hypothetical protein